MTLTGVARPETAGRRRSASSLGDITPCSPLSKGPFILHRRSHTLGQESLLPTGPHFCSTLSDSGSALDLDDFDGSLPLGRDGTTRHTSNQIAALVDFFTNYPPPPDNMSMPHAAGGCDRGRWAWSRFKKMSKRSKSLPRAPEQIRLPDSAVSGTTIGGHRHIAISIPLEVTPFAEVPRSQYPVYSPRHLPTRNATQGAEKGAVALLHSDPGDFGRPGSPHTDDHTLPPSRWIKPETWDHRPKVVTRGKPFDYIGILPAQLDTTVLNDSSAPWNRSPLSDEGSGHRGPSHSSLQQSPFPARGSSAVRLCGKGQHASIDSLLSQQQRQRRQQQQQEQQQQQQRSPDTPRRLRDQDLLSPDGGKALPRASEACLNSSEWGKPRKPSVALGLGSERHAAAKRQDGRTSGLTVIVDSPIVSHRDPSPPPPPPTITSPKNRRESVRDRKRRDMEAVRKSKLMKRDDTTSDTVATNRASRAQVITETVHERVGGAHEPVVRNDEDSSAQHLSLSNMMVVADIEPCPPLKPATRHRQSKAVPAPQPGEEGSDPPELVPQPSHPNMPTPPVSASGSPPPRRAAVDRTSLTRRREWKAIREQERKAREAIALARAEAQGLAPGGATRDGKGSQADRELMCLYEAYREHRLRDMERRLRRLERNGDVWLRALVPVLDNMNRTLAAATTGELSFRGKHEDYASDDEADSAVGRHGFEADRRRVSRLRSLTQGRLLEKLARQREGALRGDEDDDEDDDDYSHHNCNGTWRDSASGSDDMSGLGAIEPLMRELAGEARRRARTPAAAAERAKDHGDGGAREAGGETVRGEDG